MTGNESGSCPPYDAMGANATVFRCCKSNPPADRDMRTAAECDLHPHADACLRRALSVFLTQAEAEHQVRLFRRWRKKFVARAVLTDIHGKAKATPGCQPSHTSWWPADDLSPDRRANLFRTVFEVQV